MSWKAGSGHVGIGVGQLVFLSTTTDNTQVLRAGQSVPAMGTDFKLVQSNSNYKPKPRTVDQTQTLALLVLCNHYYCFHHLPKKVSRALVLLGFSIASSLLQLPAFIPLKTRSLSTASKSWTGPFFRPRIIHPTEPQTVAASTKSSLLLSPGYSFEGTVFIICLRH